MIKIDKIGSVGNIYSTRAITETTRADKEFGKFVILSLRKFFLRDWGSCGKRDKAANNKALDDGSRIVARYDFVDGSQILMVAEARNTIGFRSAITIMFPDEY